MRSTVVVVMIAMLVGGVPVSAQTLVEGERVRITKRDAGAAEEVSQELGEFLAAPRMFTGIVKSLDEASLFVELQNGNIARAPRKLVSKLEVHNGETHRTGHGFIVGALVGVFIGAALLAGCGDFSTTLLMTPQD